MWGSIEIVRGGDPSPRGRPRYNAQIPGFHTIVWIPRICATVNSAGARPPCCRWREGSLISPSFVFCAPKGVYVPQKGFLWPKREFLWPKGVSVAQKGLPRPKGGCKPKGALAQRLRKMCVPSSGEILKPKGVIDMPDMR